MFEEEFDVDGLDVMSGTFNRLKELYVERYNMASELEMEVVQDEQFARMERILKLFPFSVEDFRLGYSDKAGLELLLRVPERGLLVASVNPDNVTVLHEHVKRSHITVAEGDLTDEQVVEFFCQ